MLTLYGHANRTAANVLKLRAALAEAAIDYRYIALDLSKGDQHKPEYLAINPHGKVPVLVDDDFALPESDAILWYLAEKYPAAALLPADLRQRARVRQWCDFACTSLYTSSYELYLHTDYGDPANHSSWAAERARTALARALGVLDKRLAGRQFVATDALSIADLGVAAVVLMLHNRKQLTASDAPNIEAHYRTVSGRPAWAAAIADNP
jgi:glutathione S-transferase